MDDHVCFHFRKPKGESEFKCIECNESAPLQPGKGKPNNPLYPSEKEQVVDQTGWYCTHCHIMHVMSAKGDCPALRATSQTCVHKVYVQSGNDWICSYCGADAFPVDNVHVRE